MFASPFHSATLSRPLALAGGLALAAILIVPSVAAAAPATAATLSGDTLSASVTGGARAGVWRIRIVAPNGRQRIDFVLRTGDVEWSGIVRVSRLSAGRWTLVSRRALSGGPRSLDSAGGAAAGVRWNTAAFRLPRDGDGRFAVNVELTRKGSYRIIGALRTASEAFSFGPWKTAGRHSVSNQRGG